MNELKREQLKKWVNAFCGKIENRDLEKVLNKRTQGVDAPLSHMIDDLKMLTEEDWGLYAFSRDPLNGKFALEQKLQYTKNAFACGRNIAKRIKQKYGDSCLEEIAKKRNVQVKTPDLPVGGDYVVFAQFEEPDQISVFMDGVRKVENLMQQPEVRDSLENINIYELLLAHEIFHSVEYQERDQIYTKTEKIELWKKPFSNRSQILALSEMAGMAFAQEWMQISWSAYVLDVVLMYGYQPDAARELYEDIMETVGKKKSLEEI